MGCCRRASGSSTATSSTRSSSSGAPATRSSRSIIALVAVLARRQSRHRRRRAARSRRSSAGSPRSCSSAASRSFVWTALRYINQEYVLTNRRVIQVEGVLNRNATDSSLEKINDAVLSQSVFGRMFDFGDLTVLTAAESGHRADADDARARSGSRRRCSTPSTSTRSTWSASGWAPEPADPRRHRGAPAAAAATSPGAAATPGAQAPTAAPAAAPPAQRVDPDEVTRTLASLADLRDRGAITPEEYEGKKADLLARL